ncbi:ectonucleotide pyrophosphatase/phosphodiesterase family member 5-like isoform X2 [Tubulanus polymorphus]|uniref:ectonucleotide pyrophosphatase/phosphodiesterase family member 5-like isoform X2 n=1 Tax=Tubulanus polymorphus TaxID=672921 RepID=UPI003DA534B1
MWFILKKGMSLLITMNLSCLLLVILSCSSIGLVFGHFEHNSANPMLLLVSMDGFRWDYIDKMKFAGRPTPNFDKMIESGVHPKYVVDVFTSSTGPNHYSLATGLYEENHGIVDNTFYDPVFKEVWQLVNDTTVRDPKWYNGKPIWYVNQAHGNAYRSGVVHYPLSLAPVDNVTPFRNAGPYNHGKMPFKTRIDKMIAWFTDDDYPINFGALYFQEPDHSGHMYGPSSDKMLPVIEQMDKTLGYLLDEVDKHELAENLNIILTSDHGMADISAKKIIELDKHVHPSLYTHYSYGVMWNIIPKPGKEAEIFDKLKNIEHIKVYRRKDIPASYHYRNNRRIMPILILADEGWQIVNNASNLSHQNGTHGYNNSLSSMHPFFIAKGPAFKRNYKRGPINMLDIFALMCHILKVDMPHNDVISVVIFAALVTGIYTIGAIRQTRYHKFKRPQIIKLNGSSRGDHSAIPMLGVDSDEDDEL